MTLRSCSLRHLALSLAASLVTIDCGSSSGSGGSGTSPTPPAPTPTPRPPTFTVSVQVLNVTPPTVVTTGLPLDARSVPPVPAGVQVKVTVAETGLSVGGSVDEILASLVRKSGVTAKSRTYTRADLTAEWGSYRVPAGGQLSKILDFTFTNDTGDIVNLFRTQATIIADNGDRSTVNASGDIARPPLCTPGQTTLCIGDGRFKVVASWVDGSRTGSGTSTPTSPVEGWFWFLLPDRHDLTVKVTNGCSTNNRYWIYLAATTSVEYSVVVTDTQTGAARQYFNPRGNSFQPVQDTAALATCP